MPTTTFCAYSVTNELPLFIGVLGPSSSYIVVVHNDKKFEFRMALMKNNDSVLVF